MENELKPDSLSPEKLQLFAASMTGLPRDEIRNALSELKALDETLRAFGIAQIFFAIIPIFWPILYVQRRGMNSQRRLAAERIRNAIAVWKDDLDGETFSFDDKG